MPKPIKIDLSPDQEWAIIIGLPDDWRWVEEPHVFPFAGELTFKS